MSAPDRTHSIIDTSADTSAGSATPDPVGILADYPAGPLDETVDPEGGIRGPYREIFDRLDVGGLAGLRAASSELDRARMTEGITFIADVDGELREQPFPLDPIPRLLSAPDWATISAGLQQRTRALNAFLADVYGPAEIVRDGVIAASVVRNCPGYLAAATDLAPGGRPRAVVLGFDLLHTPTGSWVVLEDNLRVPSGLGYAIANRRTAIGALPVLHPWPGLVSPESLGRQLREALQTAAPPSCRRTPPSVAVLSDGPENSAWYEHRLLAEAMGVPVVRPDQIVGDADGICAEMDSIRLPVDVLYRRLGDDEIVDGPAVSASANALLAAAARAGTVSLVNVPGNGVADDKAMYAFVPTMIRYYLGEDQVIGDVGTWVLADPHQYAGVRDILHELVVKPVDGSGGAGVMIGPDLTAAEVSDMRARVAAEPERYIAQEVIRFSTHPTLTPRGLAPRHVDLRAFAFAGADNSVTVPDVALSRVALDSEGLLVNSSRGGGSKDTWLQR